MSTNINFDKKLGISGGTGISLPSSTPPSFEDIYSYQFDGVDDYIDTNSIYSELDGQSKASFSAWIKPTATNLLGVILHTPRNTGASDSQFQILIDNGNRLRFQIQQTGTYVFSNTGVFTANTWSHILVCYDGTLTPANRGKIFIDGVDETSAVNINVTSFSTSIGGLYIGEHSQGFWNPFSGKIDEVAIWSGIDFRNQSDVDTIYNGGIPTNLNDNGLTAPTTWFRMGESASWNGSNWTLTDQGSGGNNATSQNMAEASRVNDVPPNPFTNTLSTTFDGVDDYITLANRTQNFTDFSVSAWFIAISGGSYKAIFGNSSASGGYLFGIVNAGSAMYFYDNAWRQISGAVTDGNWHHLVVTYDSSLNELKSYIDNSLYTTYTPNTSALPSNSHSFDQIGSRTSVGRWRGNLDELAVWDSVLDSTQVSNIYNGGVPNDLASTNPIHWWRMGDGSTYPTINDEIGSNNGTMQNMSSANFVTDVPT